MNDVIHIKATLDGILILDEKFSINSEDTINIELRSPTQSVRQARVRELEDLLEAAKRDLLNELER
jgi:hypothetical protein